MSLHDLHFKTLGYWFDILVTAPRVLLLHYLKTDQMAEMPQAPQGLHRLLLSNGSQLLSKMGLPNLLGALTCKKIGTLRSVKLAKTGARQRTMSSEPQGRIQRVTIIKTIANVCWVLTTPFSL